MTIQRIEPGPLMSQAVVHNGIAYLSGLVAADLDVDVKEQTASILAKIDNTLAASGTDKTKLLKATIWLSDIGTWADMNEVWSAWIAEGTAPVRATVEANMAHPKIKVEIMVEAVVGEA